MRFFDHFGHLGHGHGAWIAVAIGIFVAVGMGAWVAISSNRKDSND